MRLVLKNDKHIPFHIDILFHILIYFQTKWNNIFFLKYCIIVWKLISKGEVIQYQNNYFW